MLSKEWLDSLMHLAIMISVCMGALSFHEYIRAVIANFLGDDTAKKLGRMTLNPVAHLDFWGTIMLLFMQVGWASSVPFNVKKFKYPRLYAVLSGAAGMFSHFILSLFSFFLLKYCYVLHWASPVPRMLQKLFLASAEVNAMLGAFNVLPIPPLDGSNMIVAAFNRRFPSVVQWLHRYALVILFLVLFIPTTRMMVMQGVFGVSNWIGSVFFVNYKQEIGSCFF